MPSSRREANARGLRLAPVDPALGEGVAPSLELLRKLGVHLEAGGNLEQLLVQRAQPLDRHRGDHGVSGVPWDARLAWRLGLGEGRAKLVVRLAQRLERTRAELRRVLRREDSLLDEPCCIRLADRRLPVDPVGHQRLRVRGLVLLVVPEAAVAHEVDHHVVTELLAVGEGEPHRRERCLGIVRIDMDDRNVEPLGEVARVARRAPFGRIGREADLVVGDDVERSAGRIAVDRVEVEGLGDDPLPRERGVPVDQDRKRDGRIVDAGAARAIGLLRPREAFDHGIDSLEMARVRGQGHLDVARPRRT